MNKYKTSKHLVLIDKEVHKMLRFQERLSLFRLCKYLTFGANLDRIRLGIHIATTPSNLNSTINTDTHT